MLVKISRCIRSPEYALNFDFNSVFRINFFNGLRRSWSEYALALDFSQEKDVPRSKVLLRGSRTREALCPRALPVFPRSLKRNDLRETAV
jgi:hypothetical protein